MKFLVDQDVYFLTVRFLIETGHDVVTAAELGLSQAADSELLSRAEHEGRILVTRDRDYGSLVFLKRLGAGVIYLRVRPSIVREVHEELRRVLSLYSQDQLGKAFVTVEPGKHRFRKVSKF